MIIISVYIEPITAESVAKIIKKERPDAILPTLGGQTALNCALELNDLGVLEEFNVEMIGANIEAINKAESRDEFKVAMEKIGLDMPRYVEGVKEQSGVERVVLAKFFTETTLESVLAQGAGAQGSARVA